MLTKRTFLSLALLAMLGACSKSPNEPVVPNPKAGEPQVGISLSGEIEFADVTPELGASSGKDLSLSSWTRLADNKRFVTPFFNDTKVSGVLAFYDGHGAQYYVRVPLTVTSVMNRNGRMVNKFSYRDKDLPRRLSQIRFQQHKKPGEPGYSEEVALENGHEVLQYREPGNEDIYVALFIGMDPLSNSPDDYDENPLPENVVYTHGEHETRMGESVDYQRAQGNSSATRLIFASTPEKHKLNLSNTGTGHLATPGPSQYHLLSLTDLKLKMRGVLLECQIENNTQNSVELKGIKVSKWGGRKICVRGTTRSKVYKKDAQGVSRHFDILGLIPSLEPVRGVGASESFDVKLYGSVAERMVQPHQVSKRIIYLPLVAALSEGKITQTHGEIEVQYTLVNGLSNKVTKTLRPLKRDGFLASTKIEIN